MARQVAHQLAQQIWPEHEEAFFEALATSPYLMIGYTYQDQGTGRRGALTIRVTPEGKIEAKGDGVHTVVQVFPNGTTTEHTSVLGMANSPMKAMIERGTVFIKDDLPDLASLTL